jgi:hypothetical protein
MTIYDCHCGGKAEYHWYSEPNGKHRLGGIRFQTIYYIQCSKCENIVKSLDSEYDAIYKWNMLALHHKKISCIDCKTI